MGIKLEISKYPRLNVGHYQVIDLSIPMSDIPAWFTGAKLNWSENMLRSRSADKIALIGARSYLDSIRARAQAD